MYGRKNQRPIIEWLKKEFSATYVDMKSEPGPNKILVEIKNQTIVDSIKAVESWGYGVQVIGPWVDENWQVHKVS